MWGGNINKRQKKKNELKHIFPNCSRKMQSEMHIKSVFLDTIIPN